MNGQTNTGVFEGVISKLCVQQCRAVQGVHPARHNYDKSWELWHLPSLLQQWDIFSNPIDVKSKASWGKPCNSVSWSSGDHPHPLADCTWEFDFDWCDFWSQVNTTQCIIHWFSQSHSHITGDKWLVTKNPTQNRKKLLALTWLFFGVIFFKLMYWMSDKQNFCFVLTRVLILLLY